MPKTQTSQDILVSLGAFTPKKKAKGRAEPFKAQKQRMYPSRKPGVGRGMVKAAKKRTLA